MSSPLRIVYLQVYFIPAVRPTYYLELTGISLKTSQ